MDVADNDCSPVGKMTATCLTGDDILGMKIRCERVEELSVSELTC
jgi:hypothetical protein